MMYLEVTRTKRNATHIKHGGVYEIYQHRRERIGGDEVKAAPSTDRAKESDYYKCGLLKWSKTPLISRISLCVSLATLIISMIVRYTTV